MMPILVKTHDVRRGRKAKVRHRWLRAAGTGVNGLKHIENVHVEKLSKVSKNKFELRIFSDTLKKNVFNLSFCHLNGNSYEASSNTSIVQIYCGVEHRSEGMINPLPIGLPNVASYMY